MTWVRWLRPAAHDVRGRLLALAQHVGAQAGGHARATLAAEVAACVHLVVGLRISVKKAHTGLGRRPPPPPPAMPLLAYVLFVEHPQFN